VGAERVVTDLGARIAAPGAHLIIERQQHRLRHRCVPDDKDVLQGVLLASRGKGESATGDIVAASDPGVRTFSIR